ncbi:MAG: RdgB/HAM1 family non-canonical purine NTP pyrophosphatase, partial [Proteobacteria bacterium]|nr:RdgB/HAM1 family non-canonical purine NTP pyrophosphatase [Pseudomonadota bacterium]
IIEDGQTFLENARIKARTVAQATGKWALGDDSGLVVAALNGEPGINSARYAGKQGDHAANNEKLLAEMKDVPQDKRQAYFTCTMVLISPDGKEWDIEEKCHGEIAYDYQGNQGFGFDPLFYLPEYQKTMAELPMSEKNKISHRGKALRHMKEILKRVWSV